MENLRELANGDLLKKFTGKSVSIMGIISKVYPNGLLFEMRTCDDATIKVTSTKPLQIEPDGFVEVHGLANGNTVTSSEVIEFDDVSETFDINSHNQLCYLLDIIQTKLWECPL